MKTDYASYITLFDKPISSAAPAGEDPRYLDEFLLIKEEINKLANTDYDRVRQISEHLLETTCKDLRIAAYHLLSCAYIDGLKGLGGGLSCYRSLIENFWDDCHPRRDNARLAALGLLNTPRLLAFADRHASSVSPELLENIICETEYINKFLISKLGEEAPRLTGLAGWCAKQKKRLPSPVPKEVANLSDQAAESPAKENPPLQVVDTISSTRELDNATHKLHGFLCKNNELYRAMALSRAMLWGDKSCPPHEQGKSKVPAPRQSAWAELKNLIKGNDPIQALLLSEKIFFEPGFRYSLDLQHCAWQAARLCVRKEIVRLIETTTLNFMERFPEITELRFADDSPFCSDGTMAWLEGIQNVHGSHQQTASGPAPDTGSQALEQAINSALLLAREKKLPEALTVLRDQPCETPLLNYRRRIAEAQLCHAAGMSQLAEMVLDSLYQHAISHHLDTWHPELIMLLIELRSKIVKQLLKTAKQEMKEPLLKIIEDLNRVACRTDLVAASRFIS